MRLTRLLSVCLLGTLSGQAAAPASEAPGTRRMADRLEQLIQRVGPERNPYVNRVRAEFARETLRELRGDPERAMDLHLMLAHESLQGGDSATAAQSFRQLMDLLARHRPQVLATNRAQLRLYLAQSYLRLGEQQNCLTNHTTESCLLPIRAAGVHRLPDASRSAIAVLNEQLAEFTNDLSARWLLNIAYMTVGEYPDKVPARWRIEPKAFASEYDLKRFTDVAGGLGLDVDDLAGGAIAEDFDGDGYLDLMCSSMHWQGQLRYFRNGRDGTFSERTREAGLLGEVGGLNIVHADYNNDGFPDVLVLRGGWQKDLGRFPNSLLRNNGDGTFADVTEEAGLLSFHPTQTAAWFDFDSDGWLDLFIGNESTPNETHPCELFRNNRNGTFTECARQNGVAITAFVKGVAAGDYNNDGRPDLYLSTQRGLNFLFRNDGPTPSPLPRAKPRENDSSASERAGVRGEDAPDPRLQQIETRPGAARENASPTNAWTFTDVTATARVAALRDSFAAWFFDYDNDGWLDLFVASYWIESVGAVAADYLGLPSKGARPRLYRNNRDGTFTDATAAAKLDRVLLVMGSNFGDIDNDGWLDMYLGTGDPEFSTLVPNRMFRNADGKFFQDVTTGGGFGHLQKGHGIAFADFDNDGDQDIYEVMGGFYSGDNYRNVLYENPGFGKHWITLKLDGVKSNRAALGARIKVTVKTSAGSRAIYKTVSTGGSFGGSPLRQEIGLGDAQSIESVEITWPVTGRVQVLKELELDQFYKIREDDTAATPWPLKKLKFVLVPDKVCGPPQWAR